MSRPCRGGIGHTAHPSRARGTRSPVIVFDYALRGFCSWARHRLELLGYRVVCRNGYQVHGAILAEYAGRLGAILVTADERLAARYPRSILLPMRLESQSRRPKRFFYEEWWTLLAHGLRSAKTE